MPMYVIRRRDFWSTPEELKASAVESARVGDEMAADVRWIRSYIVQEESGRLGTVCVYEGSSPDKVREHAGRAGMPADEVSLILEMVLVDRDPQPVAA